MTHDIHFYFAAALHSSMADLAMNRAGKLSPGQSWTTTKDAIFAFSILVMVIFALPLMMFIARVRLLKAVYLVMWLGGTTACVSLFSRAFTAARAHKPEVGQGELALGYSSHGSTKVWIGAFYGWLPDDVLRLMTPGLPYRVYYLPGTDDVLNVEPLPPPTDEASSSTP